MASDKHHTAAYRIGWTYALVKQHQRDFLIADIERALEAAEREGREDERKRAVGKAKEQAEYCMGRSHNAPDMTMRNYWAGCCDTAVLIARAILDQDHPNSSRPSSPDTKAGEVSPASPATPSIKSEDA